VLNTASFIPTAALGCRSPASSRSSSLLISEGLQCLKECHTWKLQKFDLIIIMMIDVKMVAWMIVEVLPVGVVLITMVLMIPAACFLKAWLKLHT